MHSAEREDLARRALELSSADATEISIVHDDTRLTRFTQNAIHQNVAAVQTFARVRAIVDGCSGVMTTNVLTEHDLQAAVDGAIASARLAPADPAFPGLAAASPAAGSPVDAYDTATADVPAQRRATMARAIFDTAEASGLWAAGYVKTRGGGLTIANSLGLQASFDGTDCGINVKQNGSDSTGFAERFDIGIAGLDATAVGDAAAAKAIGTRTPRAVDPGIWTVILEPPALAELLSYLTDHFSARSFDEGSSFLSDGLNRSYVSENVSIADDYAHPLAPGMAFDYEGVRKERVPLISAGVATGVVTDALTSKRLGLANTGHALPQPSAAGPMPMNLVVAPGTKSRDELIAQTPRGLLISRFWYIRPVDHRRTIVTGMTRDGTYLIEHGRLAGGVRNMRFNQSIVEALGNVEFGRDAARSTGLGSTMVVPAAKFERFRFSSVAEF